MADAPAAQLMTADELARLPDDGKLYELVRGKLICMSPSAALPGVVAGNLFARLWSFVEQYGLGILGIADSGFRLASNPDTVRAPDLWFVRAERVPPEGIPRTFWPGAPDLAVEVLSPSDRFVAVLEKAQDYLNAGTRRVWVIDPEGRSAAVFRPDGPPRLMDENGALDGEDLIPGFRVALRELLP